MKHRGDESPPSTDTSIDTTPPSRRSTPEHTSTRQVVQHAASSTSLSERPLPNLSGLSVGGQDLSTLLSTQGVLGGHGVVAVVLVVDSQGVSHGGSNQGQNPTPVFRPASNN